MSARDLFPTLGVGLFCPQGVRFHAFFPTCPLLGIAVSARVRERARGTKETSLSRYRVSLSTLRALLFVSERVPPCNAPGTAQGGSKEASVEPWTTEQKQLSALVFLLRRSFRAFGDWGNVPEGAVSHKVL